MLEVIEKLLILQDRDRKIRRVQGELTRIEPERQTLHARAAGAQSVLESAKMRVKQLESERKDQELEVEAKKQQIARYSMQQFETRKNEEYRELQHEIDQCKEAIIKIEDHELELMEQAETAQKEVLSAAHAATEARKLADTQVDQLDAREQSANRDELAGSVDEAARGRYERLVKNKGENIVVGVQHGVCGGCHMKVPPQLLVTCQAEKELVTCSNCGRILYYTRDMDLAVVD